MATTMTACLFYLLHYPPTFEQLRNEIDEVFNSVEEIKMGPQLESCRYLKACLDETLRLSPPVGGVLPREVLRGGMTIDGNFFPAGTDVGVSLYTLQRQEKYSHNALFFQPQRWMVEDTDTDHHETAMLAQSAFSPFSLGPRGCPGKGMAYGEMTLTLARIVFLFDMRLESNPPRIGKESQEPALFQTRDCFVSAHDGPVVEFRPRVKTESESLQQLI